jgi:shikimate dehydrogenase
MQAAAMRVLGLPHTYEAVHATADELPRVVAMLRAGAYDGLNMTVPHKEHVLSLVDALDPSARLAGAANTLVRGDDTHLVAHNTDAPALAAELRRLAGESPSRADARALIREIAVRARGFADRARRDAFVATSPCPIKAEPWSPLAAAEQHTMAIVQATSAGMRGGDPGDSVADVVAWDALPAEAVAIDVVYAPRDTPWLRAARRRGLRCDDGLGMLARQGALALELWLGVRAPLEAMRAALE